MDRFYIRPELFPTEQGATCSLDKEESHHCARVMRKQLGDSIEIFDGEGQCAPTEITSISKSEVELTLKAPSKRSQKISPAIILLQSIPKGKNMELIVQKSVELGVSKIIPLITARTIVKAGDKQHEKWQRIALEACKQCGQNYLPEVTDAVTFDQWAKDSSEQVGIVASLAEGAKSFQKTLSEINSPSEFTILIGPEGDLTEDEIQQSIELGLKPITLGDIVLRVETATLYCTSVARHHFG